MHLCQARQTCQQLRTIWPYTFTRLKLVCAWCDKVIAGAIIGIEGGDEVAPSICKACCEEVFEEGDRADISEIYAAIQAKSGRYEN